MFSTPPQLPPYFNFLLQNLYISFEVQNVLLCLMSLVLVFYFLNVHFTFHRRNKRLNCLSKNVATLKKIQVSFSQKTNYSCPYFTSFIFVFKFFFLFLKQKTIKAKISIVCICLASHLLLFVRTPRFPNVREIPHFFSCGILIRAPNLL